MTENVQSKYISMELRGVRDILGMLGTEFDRMKKAKREGRPIVGTWLNSPLEILLAANAFSTCYRYEDIHSEIIRGRKDLKKLYEIFNMDMCFCLDVCASLGSPVRGASREYDLVVTDFTAKLPEWNDILHGYIGEKWNFLPLEIPRELKKNQVHSLIMQKLEELRNELEAITGKEITDDAIKEACEKTNMIREYMTKIDDLIKNNLMPIKGGDLFFAYFPMGGGYLGGEVDMIYNHLVDLYHQIEDRVERDITAYSNGTKRICAIPSASNITKDVYPLMEGAGGVLVTDWPCTEHGGLLFRDKIKLTGDPIENLTQHYLKTFGIFDKVHDARDIQEMVNRLSIDAVIYDMQPDFFGYAAPVLSVNEVREILTENGIPIHVHNGPDSTGIKTFLEAC